MRVVKPIDALPNSNWPCCGLTKLRLWQQIDFKKIVYIDADCIVMENIEELFHCPSPSFCPDTFPPDRFNAGVMVISPDECIFDDIMKMLPSIKSYDGGDTGLLNAFYSDWFSWPKEHRLPFKYNALRTMYWFTQANPGYWESIKPIKILHYCSSPKPWNIDGKRGDLELIWWLIFLEMKNNG
eukprot:GHVL01031086.1.p2 GENE.GHVL01031086.1~~GHVL01031086.1.p2  ORF type:complete len:183 (-),score=23.80 GHVL01031086.1:1205-1753(-)